jgi:hypothetical protein
MNGRFVDPWKPEKLGPFRVGDRVRVPFGGGFVEATVIEDHGNLGMGGKRLYSVCYEVDDVSGESYTAFEADQLTLVTRAPMVKATKKKKSREE